MQIGVGADKGKAIPQWPPKQQEVTIEDVVDPDDIDIYRNLAGGVTTIQYTN